MPLSIAFQTGFVVALLKLALSAALFSILLGCPGEGSGVGAQAPAETATLTGVASTGEAALRLVDITESGSITARGKSGIARSVRADSGGRYTVRVDGLATPYALAAAVLDEQAGVPRRHLFSLAMRPGAANLTPLSTLLVAQLTAQTPEDFFGGLAAGSADGVDLSEPAIRAAQEKLSDYLRAALGLEVRSGEASFLDATFSPTAGDPMYDTIVALNDKLARDGSDLPTLARTIASEARACRTEQVSLTAGGRSEAFCPAGKSAQPDAADSTLIVHTFTTSAGASLTLRVRDSSVLQVRLRLADGAEFTCAAPACGGVSLGVPFGDLTREIAFAPLSLRGAASSAVLTGTLRSAEPGVVLPPLPACPSENRYFLILPDRSVEADCIAKDDFGIGQGRIATESGRGGTIYYELMHETSGQPTVRLTLKDAQVIGVTVYRSDGQANVVAQYACVGQACNGITMGPASVDESTGFAVQIRSISFDDTALALVNPDFTLAPATSARLRGSFVGFYIAGIGFNNPPDCTGITENLALLPSDEAEALNICPPPGDAASSVLPSGESVYTARVIATGDQVAVRVNAAGAVTRVDASAVVLNEAFSCAGDCNGVSVGAPDASGNRLIQFTGTTLQDSDFGVIFGSRSATLSGSFTAPPP